MARDYGRSRSFKRGQSKSRQFLQMVMGFLTGYLVASFFDFTSLLHWASNKVNETQQKSTQPAVSESARELPKPKFEFYTLLAKGRTPMPASNETRPASTQLASIPQQPSTGSVNPPVESNAKESVMPTGKENWIIQVGSFKTKPEAERMKAGLILKGYTVNVIAVTQPQGNWFRVYIGPYRSELEAKQVQVSFSKIEHVVGMVRKV